MGRSLGNVTLTPRFAPIDDHQTVPPLPDRVPGVGKVKVQAEHYIYRSCTTPA